MRIIKKIYDLKGNKMIQQYNTPFYFSDNHMEKKENGEWIKYLDVKAKLELANLMLTLQSTYETTPVPFGEVLTMKLQRQIHDKIKEIRKIEEQDND
jgi:hypothetical protein